MKKNLLPVGEWTWKNAGSTWEFTIIISQTGALQIFGVDCEDKNPFIITDIALNGAILEFTSVYPPTQYETRHLCTILPQGTVVMNTLSAALWKDKKPSDSETQRLIGEFYYEFAEICSETYRIALNWFHKSARQGSARAQLQVGWMFEQGEGVRKSYKQAAYWYTLAANQGHPLGQNNLSCCYYSGRGVEQDHERAFLLMQKAAYAGEPLAMTSLGWHYLNGVGTEENRKAAWRWYKRAAQYDDASAEFSLGLISYDEKKYVSARYWFLQAVAHHSPRAHYYIGRMYFEGTGFRKNLKNASQYLQEAASLGVARADRLLKSKRFQRAWKKTYATNQTILNSSTSGFTQNTKEPEERTINFELDGRLNNFSRHIATKILEKYPTWKRWCRVRESGALEVAVPAPKGSNAGALVVLTTDDNDIWIRFAPPRMFYSLDDDKEMLHILKKLLTDQILFVVVMEKEQWVETTLIPRYGKPVLKKEQTATVLSWHGNFDSTMTL